MHRAVLLLYSNDYRLLYCQHLIAPCASEWTLAKECNLTDNLIG